MIYIFEWSLSFLSLPRSPSLSLSLPPPPPRQNPEYVTIARIVTQEPVK